MRPKAFRRFTVKPQHKIYYTRSCLVNCIKNTGVVPPFEIDSYFSDYFGFALFWFRCFGFDFRWESDNWRRKGKCVRNKDIFVPIINLQSSKRKCFPFRLNRILTKILLTHDRILWLEGMSDKGSECKRSTEQPKKHGVSSYIKCHQTLPFHFRSTWSAAVTRTQSFHRHVMLSVISCRLFLLHVW